MGEVGIGNSLLVLSLRSRANGENRTPVMRATVARSATELQSPYKSEAKKV
jgi:hypothetical protein